MLMLFYNIFTNHYCAKNYIRKGCNLMNLEMNIYKFIIHLE